MGPRGRHRDLNIILKVSVFALFVLFRFLLTYIILHWIYNNS